MRLIDTKTLELKWHNVSLEDHVKPAYAILSHTWGAEEVTFQDFHLPERDTKKGFQKIKACCEQARKDGFRWVWIDTCCIDKTNSSELSEAINSMYEWYWHSDVCYAYLEDVLPRNPTLSELRFSRSRWFKRGWCLQELIASPKIEFYAQDWSDIGTKWSLQKLITEVTGIPAEVLQYRNLSGYSVAQKMSWAADRQTTKVEDMAYCLLGLFGIQMPLIYGEGRKAFTRLQAEIMAQTEDYSFLIWTPPNQRRRWQAKPDNESFSVLAQSPSMFHRPGPQSTEGEECSYEMMKACHLNGPSPHAYNDSVTDRHPLQMTSRGLRVHMYVKEAGFSAQNKGYFLWTGYSLQDKYVCIQLVEDKSRSFVTYSRSMVHNVIMVGATFLAKFHLAELYLTTYDNFYSVKTQQMTNVDLHDLVVEIQAEMERHSLDFLEAFPQVNIMPGLPNNESRLEFPGEVLYCSDFEEKLARFKTGWGNWPLTLKFEMHIEGSVVNVFLNLWLEHGYPRCFLWSRPLDHAEEKPQSLEDGSSPWFHESYYGQATDRAEHRIMGDAVVVTAVVKSGLKPRFGAYRLPYMVYLTVYGT